MLLQIVFAGALAIGIAGQIADWLTTKWVLAKGGVELGALAGAVIRKLGIWGAFPLKLGLGASPLLAQILYPDPGLWAFVSAIVAAGGFIPAGYNYKSLKRQK